MSSGPVEKKGNVYKGKLTASNNLLLICHLLSSSLLSDTHFSALFHGLAATEAKETFFLLLARNKG